MALEKEDLVENSGTAPTGDETASRTERTEERPRHERSHRERREFRRDSRADQRDMRSTIKAAIKEHANTPTDEDWEPSPGVKEAKEAKEAQVASASAKENSRDGGTQAAVSPDKPDPATKPGETAPPEKPQASSAIAAPAALSKEVKAIWDTLPDAAKAEFVRREADTAKGVEKLKAQWKPLDEALEPIRPQLKQLGKTEADGIKGLIFWQQALANPATQRQAFSDLAKAYGFDLATLGSQAPAQAPSENPNDPSQAFKSFVDPLNQKVSRMETEIERFQRERRAAEEERVQSDIQTFATGKPHFEKVKIAMGHLINDGLAKGDTPREVFDDAYMRACWADPEVREAIRQEEKDQREAEAKSAANKAAEEARTAAAKAAEDAEKLKRKQAEEVAKARKAGVGPRSGSPNGFALSAKAKGTSVRDTIAQALKESRAQV